MSSRLLLLLLLTSATAPAALAQSSTPAPSATPTTVAPAQYGVAYIFTLLTGECKLALQDGVTPNRNYKRYEENGHDKVFAGEAAVLNFLAAQGWDILPYGNDKSGRYLLTRRGR